LGNAECEQQPELYNFELEDLACLLKLTLAAHSDPAARVSKHEEAKQRSCNNHLLGAPVVVRNLAGQVLVRKGTGSGRRQETLPLRLGTAGVEAEPVAQV